MKTLGNELMSVYHSLSLEQQSKMIAEFQKLLDRETDEPLKNFYAGIIAILEQEKKQNV